MPIPPSNSPAEPQPIRPLAPLAPPPEEPEEFQPVALIMALLLPGLGHWYLGDTKRAVLIAIGVLGLFFGGMLIGGIDVIDSREDTIWFVGQALVGPVAFGVDYAHQNMFKVTVPGPDGRTMVQKSANPNQVRGPDGRAQDAGPKQLPPNSKSLGRMNELGTLFATIAGMLNLIVVVDASVGRRRARA